MNNDCEDQIIQRLDALEATGTRLRRELDENDAQIKDARRALAAIAPPIDADGHIHWASLSFLDLKAAHERSDLESSGSNFPLINRYGNIMNLVESDQIWPPNLPGKEQFLTALCEVLSRLPSQVFDHIEDGVSIILEIPATKMTAVNVHGPCGGATSPRQDTIVFFHPSWELTPKALVGLIAHELAHSIVDGANYEADEALANQQAKAWGFADELKLLEIEKGEKLSVKSSVTSIG